jgi:hypothetical protein
MIRWQKNIIALYSVLSTVILLTACGGGGDNTANSQQSTNTDISTDALNPDLSGKLMFEDDGNAWLMDMSSGAYTTIPNTNWLYHDNYYGSTNDFWLDMGPIHKNEFTVTTLDDCDIEDTTSAICVAIQDLNGNYLAHIRFLGDARSSSKLSFDTQYIAIIRQGIYSHDKELRIYDRSGQQLSSRFVSVRDFEWLHDNRIIYATDRELVITDELSTNPSHGLALPSGMEGTIGTIELSPDGGKLAFTVVTSGTLVSTHATPWVVNIDGSGLRQLAVSRSETPPPSIVHPRWSPDGKWILLKEGAFTGNSPLNPGSSGYAYVVPAQDMGKTFTLSIIDSERSPEAFLLNRYERIETNPTSRVVNKHFSSSVSWIP